MEAKLERRTLLRTWSNKLTRLITHLILVNPLQGGGLVILIYLAIRVLDNIYNNELSPEMFQQQLAQQFIMGLSTGSIYALIALGYTLVYGILFMINFAHGEVFMAGAYIGFFAIHAFLNKIEKLKFPGIIA